MATRTISDAGGEFDVTTTWVEGIVPVAGDSIVATATSGDVTNNDNNLPSGAITLSLSLYTGSMSLGGGGLDITGTNYFKNFSAYEIAASYPDSPTIALWSNCSIDYLTSGTATINLSCNINNINESIQIYNDGGVFYTNGYTVTASQIELNSLGAIDYSGSTLNVTTFVCDDADSTGITSTSGSILNAPNLTLSDVTINGEVNIATGGAVYLMGYTQAVTFSGDLFIAAGPSGTSFAADGAGVLTLEGGMTTDATSDNPLVISGNNFEISKSSGTVSCSYMTLTGFYATGGATWNAINSIDNGGNGDWVFSGSHAYSKFFTSDAIYASPPGGDVVYIRPSRVQYNDDLTISDSKNDAVGKNVSESVSSSDSFVKARGRALSESISISEAYFQVHAHYKSFSESISSSDSIQKNPGLNPGDTINTSDSIGRVLGLSFSDSVSSSDSDTEKDTGLKFSDIINSSDLIYGVGIHVSDTLSSSDTFNRSAVFGRSFSDTISSSDIVNRMPGKGLSDSMSESDSMTHPIPGKLLFDSLSSNDSVITNIGKYYSDSISIKEVFYYWVKTVPSGSSWTNKGTNKEIWTPQTPKGGGWVNK